MVFARTPRAHDRKAQEHERGFTLIETFVAISVLMVALVGPLTLAQQSLRSASISSDQVAAFYLAQEAIEYVRNVRDSNIRNGRTWLTGLTNCIDAPCAIETSMSASPQTALIPCSGESCRLLYNEATGRYGYLTGQPSAFRRETVIETLQTAREVLVTTTVTWKTGKFTGSYSVSQSLFNLAAAGVNIGGGAGATSVPGVPGIPQGGGQGATTGQAQPQVPGLPSGPPNLNQQQNSNLPLPAGPPVLNNSPTNSTNNGGIPLPNIPSLPGAIPQI